VKPGHAHRRVGLYVDLVTLIFDLDIVSLTAYSYTASITYLQNVLQAISSWMSANLLTLNTSKTEFLLIGLKQQLATLLT